MGLKDKPDNNNLQYAMLRFKSNMGTNIKFITICLLTSCATILAMTFVMDNVMNNVFNHLGINNPFVSSSITNIPPFEASILPPFTSDEEMALLPPSSFSYLTIVDAGSSGCRAHVFRYGRLGHEKGPLYIVPKHVSLKVKPGLSSFKDKPSEAGQSLKGLIDFMKENVPQDKYSTTPIWLKATAGLRMLNTNTANAILTSVRNFLSNNNMQNTHSKTDSSTTTSSGSNTNVDNPFLFRPEWAKVISGQEEGATGWLAFNYLMRLIGPKDRRQSSLHHSLSVSSTSKVSQSTMEEYAVVEMGGASSQVTQRAPTGISIPESYKFNIKLDNEDIVLYTHSYLGFGGEQGREQVNKQLISKINTTDSNHGDTKVSDPCLNNGLNFNRGSTDTRSSVYEGVDIPTINTISSSSSSSSSSNSKHKKLLKDSDQGSVSSVSVIGIAGGVGDVTKVPSDGTACMKNIQGIFDANNGNTDKNLKKNGDKKNCGKTPQPISFDCTFQPAFVPTSKNLMVFENFFYTASAGGVNHHSEHMNINRRDILNDKNVKKPSFPLTTTPLMYRLAARRICSKNWNDLQAKYPIDGQPKDVNTKLCFGLSFAASFLIDGMHLRPNKEILVAKDVNGSDIEWALGAAYMESSRLLSGESSSSSSSSSVNGLNLRSIEGNLNHVISSPIASICFVIIIIILAYYMSRSCSKNRRLNRGRDLEMS